MVGQAVISALRPKQLPFSVTQFYDGWAGPKLANSIVQRVVMKHYGKVFVIRIRVWQAGRWRGEILVHGNQVHDVTDDVQFSTKAKHYKFLNFEAAKTWFRADWQQDWVRDFDELTNWDYADELSR